MNFLTIAFTRVQRLRQPEALPTVTQAQAEEWFRGWWHGIAVGSIIGAGLMVMFLKMIGRLP
jgi:hypothetical protein